MKYDESLVVRAMAGESRAFEELYKQIYEDLYRFAYYMLGNKDDAIDAVSDAVTDMYKCFGYLKNYRSFSSWSMKILWTKCKQKRKEYINKKVESPLEEVPETAGYQSDDYIDNLYLREQLMTLDEDERTIILLNVIYGYNSREIGKLMNLKHNTVRSKQSRALEKLRERMNDYGR